jgi:hypothetical protein
VPKPKTAKIRIKEFSRLFSDPARKAHDGVSIDPGDTLNRPDGVSFDQQVNNLNLLVACECVCHCESLSLVGRNSLKCCFQGGS